MVKCVICNSKVDKDEVSSKGVCICCYESPSFCLNCNSKNINDDGVCKDCGSHIVDTCKDCGGHVIIDNVGNKFCTACNF